VQETLTEFAQNSGFEREGLFEYSLTKIVNVVGVVSHAHARGIDPELLRVPHRETRIVLRDGTTPVIGFAPGASTSPEPLGM
jgi:hypothetical protein